MISRLYATGIVSATVAHLGYLTSLVTRSIDWSRMSSWSTVVVSIQASGPLHIQAHGSGGSWRLPRCLRRSR